MSDATLVHQTAQTNARPVSVGEVPQTRPWLDREIGDPKTGENPALADHAFQQVKVTRPGDAFEQEAERSVDAAVGPAAPVRRSTQMPQVTPDLVNQIDSAGAEGKNLPDKQRGFFEERLGHDFGSVRVHAGPRAADAAQDLNAEAFTRGQNVYFGAGYYQPDTPAGQRLMAHELAHTLQPRPGVIARQAVAEAGVAAANGNEPSGDTVTSGESLETLSSSVMGTLHSGQQSANRATQQRLSRLDPLTRLAVLARIRSQLPPADRASASELLENASSQQNGATPARQPTMNSTEQGSVGPSVSSNPSGSASGGSSGGAARSTQQSAARPGGQAEAQSSATPAPAPIQVIPESPESGAGSTTGEAEHHTAAAAQNMQTAVRAAKGQALNNPSSPTEDEGAGSQRGDTEAAPVSGAAASSAQAAVAAMNDQATELSRIGGSQVEFGVGQPKPMGDPKAAANWSQSESLATSFLHASTQQIGAVLSAALNAVPQVMASLTAAKATVGGAITAQVASIHAGTETARKSVTTASRQARGQMDKKRGETETSAERGADRAQDRAITAQKTANGDVDKQANSEDDDISKKYRDAVDPARQVGERASGKAVGVASKKAQASRSKFNGESSILDGPIHNDRLEARATAAEQVGAEYGKSFKESANDQANKLSDSKPEVTGKISEITGQVKKGLDDQLSQMNDGVSAFRQGARARATQTYHQLSSSAANAAKHTTEALTIDEQEQSARLAEEGTAQQQALDETVSSGLGSLTDGVTQSIGQMVQSMDEFSANAANMAAPAPEKLSPVLSDVTGQTNSAVATMGQQVQTIGPTMDGNLGTARDQAVKSLTDASTTVQKNLAAQATSLGGSMRVLSQQASRGFGKMMEGDTKTSDGMGKNAEDGFEEASKQSQKAFGMFGEKVDENFAQGRDQLFNNLWSKESQQKLDSDMEKYGDEAADKVQPRWKKVLKWVITIVVILAVIAITVLSAGSLGPVGVVLLGASLGAAAGAVTTIAHNLIDGKKWSEGVAKAMIVGAIGGAFGGVGGVLVKGVGSLALKIGLEAGINIVGGVTSEVIGSVAVGETINWTNAVTGALIGAGIGAGLGIAGALKGKIRFGGSQGSAPAEIHPSIEPPPPPAGRVRLALEKAKILAPRSAPVVPEGAAASATSGSGSAPDVNAHPVSVSDAPQTTAVGESARAPAGQQPSSTLGDVTGPQGSAPQAPAGENVPGAQSQQAARPPAPTTEAPASPARSLESAPRETPLAPDQGPANQPASETTSGYTKEDNVIRPDRFNRQPNRPPAPEVPESAPRSDPSAESSAAADRGRVRRAGTGNRGEGFAREGDGVIRPDRFQPRPDASLEQAASEVQAQPQRAAVAAGAEGFEPVIGDQPAQVQGGAMPESGNMPVGGSNPVEAQASANRGGGSSGRSQSGRGSSGGKGNTEMPAPAKSSSSRGGGGAGKGRSTPAERAPTGEATTTPANDNVAGGEVSGSQEGASPQGPGASRPQPVRRPPADLPEYPQFPESVKARGHQEALEFFQQNKNAYPKRIQDAIDAARPGVKSDVLDIDRMIRSAQMQRGNRALGFEPISRPVERPTATGGTVVEPSSPFTNTTKGHAPGVEGTEFEYGATIGKGGTPKNLTYEGQTKTGETVQIDDFNFKTQAGKEVKMPMAIAVDPRYFARNFGKVVDQMRRQAQFIKDWNFTKYTWEMYSAEDAATAAAARSELSSDLASKIEIKVIH